MSLLRTVPRLIDAGISVTYAHLTGMPHVDDARNLLAHDFLQSRATHLLWWDADVAAEPGAALALLQHGVDVVGGAYPYKEASTKFTVKLKDGAKPDDRGLVEAWGLPTGFLCVSRRAMEIMAKRAQRQCAMNGLHNVAIIFERDVTYADDAGGERIGGDFNFCKRWIEYGEWKPGGPYGTAKVYCDPTLMFTHQGTVDFAGRLSDHLNEAAQ